MIGPRIRKGNKANSKFTLRAQFTMKKTTTLWFEVTIVPNYDANASNQPSWGLALAKHKDKRMLVDGHFLR
jgi:hypothetical protein